MKREALARPTTSSSQLSSSSGSPRNGGDDGEGCGPADQPFLWEQISASLDPVELHEVQRVVGASLVQSVEDVYAEVRALGEILADYAGETDELIKSSTSVPRSLGSQPAGLVQLELTSLVSQLKKRAAAAGAPEDALLPAASSPQRKALESVLCAQDDAGAGAAARRQLQMGVQPSGLSGSSVPGADGATGERVSLRDMRAGSRPSTATSRPGTSSYHAGSHHGGSRPGTGSVHSAGSRPATSRSGAEPGGGRRPARGGAQVLSLEDAAPPSSPLGGREGGDGDSEAGGSESGRAERARRPRPPSGPPSESGSRPVSRGSARSRKGEGSRAGGLEARGVGEDAGVEA